MLIHFPAEQESTSPYTRCFTTPGLKGLPWRNRDGYMRAPIDGARHIPKKYIYQSITLPDGSVVADVANIFVNEPEQSDLRAWIAAHLQPAPMAPTVTAPAGFTVVQQHFRKLPQTGFLKASRKR